MNLGWHARLTHVRLPPHFLHASRLRGGIHYGRLFQAAVRMIIQQVISFSFPCFIIEIYMDQRDVNQHWMLMKLLQ